MIRKFIGSIVDIRKGELLLTALMFASYYLLLVTYYLLKPARDSLFLVKVDPVQLPIVFILIALVTVPVITVYNRIGRSLRLNRLIYLTMAVVIGSLLILRWLTQWDHPWIYYLFYIWVSIYGALTTAQYWLLASTVFNASQAKRLFVLLGVGGITGAVTGGELTNLIVGTLRISTQNLLLVCIGCLVIFTILINIIWAKSQTDDTGGQKYRPRRRRKKEHLFQTFGEIRQSRHLLLIVGIIALTMMVASFIDYQFKVVSSESIQDTEKLTGFLGKFYGRLSVVSLILQLLFTHRILRIFGVGGIIMILPMGLLLGSAAMFLFPGLTAAVLLRGADGSMKYSFDKTGRELLFLPVPSRIKERVKIFIDVFVDRWFRGIAGALLLLCTMVLQLSIRNISLVVIGLVAIWLVLALMMRKEYVNAFRQALEKRHIDLGKISVNITDPNTVNTLLASLDSGKDWQIRYALEMLQSAGSREIIGPVRGFLTHSSPEIRRLAAQILSDQGGPELVDEMKEHISDSDPEVRAIAIGSVYRYGTEDKTEFIRSCLKGDDLRMRAAAIGYISQFGGKKEKELIDISMIEALLSHEGPDSETLRLQLAGSIRDLYNPKLRGALEKLLNDRSPDVVRKAIISLGHIKDSEFVPWLFGKLGDKNYRGPARKALASYGAGIVETVVNYMNNEKVSIAIRIRLPLVIGDIPRQESVDILTASLHKVNPWLKYYVIKGLNHLRDSSSKLKFDENRIFKALVEEARTYHEIHRSLQLHRKTDTPSGRLLARALIEKLDVNLEQIFRLMGLTYPARDIYNAYNGLVSSKKALRGNAVEFLDNLLRSDIKKYILPIIDDTSELTAFKSGEELFGIRFATSQQALAHLITGRDDWLRVCAIYHAAHLEYPELHSLVQRATGDPNSVVRETALLASEIQEKDLQ